MLSQLVTGGSTLIRVGTFHYFGARLSTGAYTLTVHDTNATANATEANRIDTLVHVASQPTLDGPISGDKGRHGLGGLVTVLTSGATATIFYT